MIIITPDLITDILKGALLPVAGAVGQSAAMIGGEWIKFWQMKNAAIVGKKAVEILKSRGITNKNQLKTITTKFGLLYIEGASVEDQAELQELWAKLLANAFDPHFEEDLRISFMSIIKDLSTTDVLVINLLRLKTKIRPKFAFGDGWPEIDYITEFTTELNEDKNSIDISFDNLFRLRIVDNKNSVNVVASSHPNMQGEKRKTESALSNRYPYFTSLGLAFIKACVNETKNRTANAPE